MKNIISLFLILLFNQSSTITASSFKQLNASNELDTIKYSMNGFNSLRTLLLTSEATFIYEDSFSDCIGGFTKHFTYGKYTRNRNKIELFPKSGKSITSNSEIDKQDTSYYEIEELKEIFPEFN